MGDALRWWLVAVLPRPVARWIWCASEWTGIPLGRAAPYVFGQMLGVRGHKLDRPAEEKDEVPK